jgi:iron complex outermembrane receptor protein
MFIKRINILVCFFLLFFSPVLSYSETKTEDFLEMSLYELMNVEVITPGRLSQKISEAPAAMSVVTAEDIRQSGATSLSEALEMVVGVHLGRTSSSFQAAGGIRGFHKLPANKMALFINGVPWSFEMYNVPGLNQLAISLEEIEQIEVMRGPGSSLYGASAMFGVINVITKNPKNTLGTLFSVTAGEQETLIGTMMHGGSVDEKLFYRFTMGWNQTENKDYIAWSNDPETEYWKMNTTLDYYVNDNSSVSFFAGYLDPIQQDVIVESTGPVDQSGADIFQTILSYKAKDPNITLKAHLKDSGWSEGESMGKKLLNFKMGTRGIELQHKWQPFAKDTLVWGANFDQKYAEGPAIGGKHTHDLPGIFFDNTYDLTDQVSLNMGFRCDKHPNTDYTGSHRLSLLYSPHTRHNFRLTWGTSYRNPDFIESYYVSPIHPYEKGKYRQISGQEDIDPEKAETYELGYYGQLSEQCVFSINLFYSYLDDFIYFVQNGEPDDYPLNDEMVKVYPFPFMNIGDAEQYGAEVELNYQITRWLNGIVNYSYSDQHEKDDQIRELLVMTPRNMANGQLRARFDNGFSANASIHYKDVTEWRQNLWPSSEGNTIAGGRADSHVYANLRLGYEFTVSGKHAELGVAAFNVFNTKFDEYPLSTSDVTRRVTGSFLIHF